MNKNLLKAKILEAGMTVRDLCEKCDISVSTFYTKLRGDSEFTQHEIAKVINLLHIDMETARRIFFM